MGAPGQAPVDLRTRGTCGYPDYPVPRWSIVLTPPILVVDDDAFVRRVMADVVTSVGGTPVLAEGYAAALDVLATHDFSCALIDKHLPDGTGLELVRHIKERFPSVEVIVMTGQANLESALQALRLGATDYLVKPFDLEAVTKRLEVALRVQARLLQASRMASLGTLCAGVSHELNNPLTAMLVNLELLRAAVPGLRERCEGLAKQLDRPAPRREAEELGQRLGDAEQLLSDVHQAAERMRQLVKDLNSFSRADDFTRHPVDLPRLLDAAVGMAGHEIYSRGQLFKRYQPTPMVLGNEARLSQVFVNLLVNAAQSLGPDAAAKEIHLSTGTDPSGRAMVEVRDTGEGIPPDLLGRIFEPFFTTKPVGLGTGLGLSICYGIITAHQGELAVESEVGKGTTFRVYLPAAG